MLEWHLLSRLCPVLPYQGLSGEHIACSPTEVALLNNQIELSPKLQKYEAHLFNIGLEFVTKIYGVGVILV